MMEGPPELIEAPPAYITGHGWTHLRGDRDTPLDALCAGGYDVNEVLNQFTPLSEACVWSRLDFVQWLLAHGADPNPEVDGFSPIDACASVQALDCAKALFAVGATISDYTLCTAFNSCHSFKLLPREFEFILLLLDRGANLTKMGLRLRDHWVYERYFEMRRDRRIALRVLGACLCARVATKDTRRLIMKNAK